MHEEDVHRAVRSARPRRVGRQQRPARAAGIVGRRRRAVGLERLARVERGAQQLVAEHEGGDQGQDQQRPAGHLEAVLQRQGWDNGCGGLAHGSIAV